MKRYMIFYLINVIIINRLLTKIIKNLNKIIEFKSFITLWNISICYHLLASLNAKFNTKYKFV